MIFGQDEIWKLPNNFVMTDGSFDPLHDGHILYFQAAASLGFPVVCNVASDSYTSRKHPVLLNRERRLRVIDSIQFVDFVYSPIFPTHEVLRQLKPRIYVKGSDWVDRGGVPQPEQDACRELGIEIHYVDLPKNSSTSLLQQFMTQALDALSGN